MLTFEEARAAILAGVTRLGHERVAVGQAAGRVAAAPLLAARRLPPFDYSAMDGYALRLVDLVGSAPFRLTVQAEESRTGRQAPPLEPSATCRIFTGAELPRGADAVVMQEEVTRDGAHATFATRPAPGAHIRSGGEDIEAGQVAITEGARLHAGHLMLAASLDEATLVVARRPRVAIVCTGDELREPGTPGSAASIPESNSPGLGALARQVGAEPNVFAPAPDDLEASVRVFTRALETTDLLVTVGGVSVGDHDVVRPALERIGVTLDFYKVAIKPGKPLAYGHLTTGGRTVRVLGLPGNPASALTTFALFGAPLLRALQGDVTPLPLLVPARLKTAVRHRPGRMELVRVTLEREGAALVATPLPNQASGATTTTAWATALMFVPLEAEHLPEGSVVDVLRLADV
jgi:molybdopterin molybdotransferase